MVMHAIHWLVLGVAATVAIPSSARPLTAIREEFTLTAWESDEDLPNNDVHSIAQDQSGFLWLGTASGLVRFDGRQFRRPHGTDERFFQAATTYSIAETANGELLFVHDLDAENRLLHIHHDRIEDHPAGAALAPGERAVAVFSEVGGVVWVLLADRTWLRWSRASVARFPPDHPVSSHFPSGVVPLSDGRALLSRGSGLEVYGPDGLSMVAEAGSGPVTLAAARDGGAWIANRDGLLHHHGGEGPLRKLEAPVPPGADWPPQLMLEAGDGALWLYFRGAGLFRRDDGGIVEIATSHPILRCLTEDQEGNIWVGTAGGGLNRIRRSTFAQWATERPDTIGSVCEDANGEVWLGNARGVWRLRTGKAERPDNPADWPTFAHALCPTPDGALWIGGARRVFRHRPGIDPHPQPMEPEVVDHAYALFRAGDGAVWAGCESGPLLRYDATGRLRTFGPESGYHGRAAQVFGEADDGSLWVGTRRGELYVLRGERFEKIPTPLDGSSTGILTITRGGDDTLWLGTRGLGFLRWKRGGFRFVGPQDGLPDGVISQTLADDAGNFWIGSSNGIFMVPLADLDACADGRLAKIRPERFGRSEGITGFYATGQRQPCAWKSADGRMWFVGRKGVVTVDPAQRRAPAITPKVFIDDAWHDGGPLLPGVAIPSGNRRLEFRFTSPSFQSPSDVRFRYRLAGFDRDWSEPTDQASAIYPQLAPGSYLFEVQASHRRHVWSPVPALLAIDVRPAWWELTWLRVCAAVGAMALLSMVVRRWSNRRLRRKTAVLEQERKIERERVRIARDLHDGIGSGLTQLGWLAAEVTDVATDSASVRGHSQSLGHRIHDLARDLDAAVWAVSPRHDTLASLCSYLSEFALEHFRRSPIRCRVASPDHLPVLKVEPQARNHLFMATRESLNNVLKHAAATEVHLRISFEDGRIAIEIADDGRGFDPATMATTRRNGLGNLRERMREIGGTCEITSQPGTGTRVLLCAPLHRGR